MDPHILAAIEASDIPHYEVLQDTFIEPHIIHPQSIIRTHAEPGPHLRPLNKAAWDRWEQWTQVEIEGVDAKGDPTGKMIRPRTKFFQAPYEAAERQTFDLVAGPPRELRGQEVGLNLAEAQLRTMYPSMDQRPPPAPSATMGYVPPPVDSGAKAPPPPGAVAGPEGEALILHAAPAPKPPSAR